MNIRVFIIILIALVPAQALGQGRYDVWYFGKGVGLDFKLDPPDTLMDGAMDVYAGSATICDSTGALLYYTDGDTVWDSDHHVLPNGTGLTSLGAVQAALIVEKPGSTGIYYVFTSSSTDIGGARRGLHYSVIQNGAVVQKNRVMTTLMTEWIAGYYNRTEDFYWIATVGSSDWLLTDSSELLLYKFSKSGVSLFSRTTIPFIGARGQLVFSPNGAILGLASETTNYWIYDYFYHHWWGKIILFDFNVSNGEIASRSEITNIERGMDMAFSPNSKQVYFTGLQNDSTYGLFQVPVDSFKNDSLTSTYHHNLIPQVSISGGLQLGCDGRIYFNANVRSYLSTVNNPDKLGMGCDFKFQSIPFKEGSEFGFPVDRTRRGLPNAVSNLIIIPQIEIFDSCAGLPLRCALNYSYADSVDWIMGDGQIISSGPDTFQYTYKEPGSYVVKAVLHYPTHIDTFSKMIRMLPLPEPDLGHDTLLCTDEFLEFRIESNAVDSFVWENSHTSPNRTIDQEGVFRLNIYNDYCAVEDTLRVVYTTCDILTDSLCLGDRTRLWTEDPTVDSIHWDFGDRQNERHTTSTVHHQYASGGTYSVSANIYKSGLERNIAREVSITAMPPDFLPDELSGCDPLPFVPLLDSSKYRFRWGSGDTSALTEFYSSGVYKLEIERNGCLAVDSMFVEVQNCDCPVYVPNAFSPNHDQFNAVFQPTFTCAVSNPELVIYSLWGEQLMQGATSWDGTYKGKTCPTSTYLWILTYVDQTGEVRKQKGYVHLLR